MNWYNRRLTDLELAAIMGTLAVLVICVVVVVLVFA